MGEIGKIIRVGILPIYARPLTLLQVQEIGEEMQNVEVDLESKDYQSLSAYVLTHPDDAKAMNNAVIKALFRKRWQRRLFGKYVLNHLTSGVYKEVYASIQASFDYNFFMIGLIFLQGTKKEEKATENQTADDTKQATRRGVWSDQ